MNKTVCIIGAGIGGLSIGALLVEHGVGVTVFEKTSKLGGISDLVCTHDSKSGRIMVDKYLEVPKYEGVLALGDCAFIIDPNTGNPYPPTAQHAIREGAVVAKNIITEIEEQSEKKEAFNYKTKGMMASIGKRTGVGSLIGNKFKDFLPIG